MKVDWFKTVQFLFAGQFCLKVIWRFRMEPHETAKASNRNDSLKLLLIYIYIYKEVLCLMLSYTHAGLYYVYHIVAEFLAFLDDIHIHGTDGVGIEMIVYIVDVLALQLITIVVDFVLDVEREVGIIIYLMTHQ